MRKLGAEFHQVLAMSPGQRRPVLVSSDAIGLGPIVRIAHERCVTGKVNQRSGGLQIRYAFVSGNAGLLHDVLSVERARIQEQEVGSIVTESRFSS